MTAHVAFDTLAFSKRLKAAGMEPRQAEAQAAAQAELLSNLMDDKLATKDDILHLRTDLKHDMEGLKGELTHQIHTTMFAGIGLLATMLTLFHFIK